MLIAHRTCLRALAFGIPLFLALCTLQFLWPIQPEKKQVNQQGVEEAASGSLTARVSSDLVKEQLQHLQKLGVARWHSRGFRGQGIKIAVLDSGFKGYRDLLGSALPRKVKFRSFRLDKNLEGRDSQHGLLCAEVIHAIAPKADLMLVNWESNDQNSFLEAVRWARRQGAHIISCSLIMPSWSDGEGGGKVNKAIEDLVGKGGRRGDMLFFAAAGNTAERHWSGKLKINSKGYHEWAKGEVINRMLPWGAGRVAVEIYGPNAGEMELEVRESATGQIMVQPNREINEQVATENHCVFVRFVPEPMCEYQVRVRSKIPAEKVVPEKFHLVILGGTLHHATAEGSICCPADGPGALAISAVDDKCRRLTYSSRGPNSKLPKPDFVATIPFPSRWRDRPFAGTSAASPQAAGVAALMWSANRSWTAGQVREYLRRNCLDLGPPGHDPETGYGLIQLP